jgi:outer membrane protein assembly factor BamB
LFGGFGFDTSTGGYLNDLWKWDGTYWTWVSGSNTRNQYGSYGTLGVPNSANAPGSRNGSLTWKDASGNLWLFGGYGFAASTTNYLNDLWKWDGTYWTWVSGSNQANQAGVYGTKGVPAAGNIPGARTEAVSWIDATGNFLLFGGYGYGSSATTAGRLNDLWKWDGASWTWLSGSKLTNQYGVYGTKGVPNGTNLPGARNEAVSWTDRSGNLWLFSGFGYAATVYDYLNDLWKWDGTNWTWVGGSSNVDQYGVYGTTGVSSNWNAPGARYAAVSWVDRNGNAWLFGGLGFATSAFGFLNELWIHETDCTLLFGGATAVTALTGGSCGYRVTWPPAPACSSRTVYNVYRSTTTGVLGSRVGSCLTGFSHEDSAGPSNNTTYYYVVRAENLDSPGGGPCGGTEDSNLAERSASQLTCVPASVLPQPVSFFSATARDSESVLQWLNPATAPSSPFRIRVQATTGTSYPASPTDGTYQTTAGSQLVNTKGRASLAATNGTTYRYGIYADDGCTTPCSPVYSAGRHSWGLPFPTSGAEKWRYTTGATAMTPPGINSIWGGNSAVGVSNDRAFHAMNGTGTNAGEWPGSFVPSAMNAPAQARPIVIPGLTAVTGHDRVVYVGAQDGRLYAFDAVTGGLFASTSTALGDSIQGSATGVFTVFGGPANRIFVGTRNATGDNKVFARNASDLSAVWEFNGGGGIGIINGDVFVDYSGQKVYFASRAGTNTSTVWCVAFAGAACSSWTAPALGDIDSSPHVESGVVYVGTNSGTLHALDATTGGTLWAYTPPVADGPVKSFVWTDVSGNRAYYSTSNNVWAVNLTTHALAWQKDLTGLAPSAPLVLNGKLYVGLSNGNLMEIDTTTPASTKQVALESGAAVGEPGYDNGNGLIYVGTEAGVIHAVAVPLP